MRSRVVDEDSAHDVGGHTKKVCTVLPVFLVLIDQVDVRFVNERCRLKRVVWPLVAHVACGNPVKFSVNSVIQLALRLWIALTDRDEQFRDVRRPFVHNAPPRSTPGRTGSPPQLPA
jgi:hypothetical protein